MKTADKKELLKSKQFWLNVGTGVLAILFVGVLIWGFGQAASAPGTELEDGIHRVDLDTIYLEGSKVEVDFRDVILTDHKETRKLIVSTQRGTVNTQLTDRLIQALDFDFLKKTQEISYTGTGYFVVDLDNLTPSCIVQDKENKTVTIRIGHAYLQAIEIDPEDIIIADVKEGLLARGDVELTVKDYNIIEKELRTRLEEKFNTAINGQLADDLALKMVREVYEPIVQAVDPRYKVIVEFR